MYISSRSLAHLRALGCPWPDLLIQNREEWSWIELANCVLWLENTVVRHLPPNRRGWLQETAQDRSKWMAEFIKYCATCGVSIPNLPKDGSIDSVLPLFEGLVYRALEESYTDAFQNTQDEEEMTEDISPHTVHVTTTRAPQEVCDLVKDMVIHPESKMLEADLPDPTIYDAINVLHSRLVEGLNEKPKSLKYVLPRRKDTRPDLVMLTRLLATEQLIMQQRIFNELLTDLQRNTADPKTDQSLGKVGF